MTQQQKEAYSKISTPKKAFVIFGFFGVLFGGIFAFIISVDKIRNYLHPYIFSFLLGIIGLRVGRFIAKQIKPYVIINKKMLANYSMLTFQFSLGFIGLFILVGHYVNFHISKQTKCDQFTVLNNLYIKGGHRRPEFNILYVDIAGKTEKLLCSHNYWNSITKGQKVRICIYKSPIGFDNIVLTGDR